MQSGHQVSQGLRLASSVEVCILIEEQHKAKEKSKWGVSWLDLTLRKIILATEQRFGCGKTCLEAGRGERGFSRDQVREHPWRGVPRTRSKGEPAA